jgi:outer membrane lipase/esterase
MSRKTRLAALAAAFLSASAFAPDAFAQQRFIAFGDSLSDNGNLFAAAGTPPPPYFAGRFSNGPTFVELLSGGSMAGFFPVGPVNNALSTNFAFGGARTDAAVANPPGSGTQIGAFIARGGQFTPGSVTTLWAGANDIFQALPVAGATPATAQAVMTGVAVTAASNVGAQTAQLAAAGARQIVVLNLPNFGALPQFAGTAAAQLAGLSSGAFNGALSTSVGAAAAGAPAANVVSVDIASVFSALQANPAAFGFTDASSSCIATAACVGVPANRDGFAFWDGVHPTAAGHRLIAAVVDQYLRAPVLAGVYSALGEIAIDDRRLGLTRAFDRLDGVRFGKLGVNDYFVNAQGGVSNGDGAVNRPSHRASSFGVNFGLNRALTTNWGLTASGTVGVGTAKIARMLDADTFNAAFDVGAVYTSGVFFAKGGAGFGVTHFSDMQRTTVAPLFNRSSATAATYNVGVEAGTIHGLGVFELSPRARLAFLGGQVGDINEVGIVAPLAIGSHAVNALLGGVELRATANIVNTAAQKVAVTALIGYERYLSYSGNDLTGRLIGNTAQPFRTVTADPKGPGVILGLGLSSQMASGWTISADYRASIGERSLVRHNGQIGVKTSF